MEKRLPVPFRESFFPATASIIDDGLKKEWADDLERRLLEVLPLLHDQRVLNYAIKRFNDRMCVYTVSEKPDSENGRFSVVSL